MNIICFYIINFGISFLNFSCTRFVCFSNFSKPR